LTKKAAWMVPGLLVGVLPVVGLAQDSTRVSARFKALECPPPTVGTTWAILERDGANRQVEPYLSSLGQGEAGTGVVTSPPFVIARDTITFTICGHDGQQGGRGENYIALVDARKGNVLVRTEAPLNDAMQERSWDVSGLRGVEVRIEVHDGNSEGAYAWLGVGRIDAGPAMNVDFRQGMPEDWDRPRRAADVRYELVAGGIPFERNALAFSLIPETGTAEIPCGFAAKRLYLLGCTVAGGKPLTTYGGLEIHYRTGSPEVFPLMCGFTLDGQHKLLSPSKAIYLHPSADPFQPYLVIAPRDEVIARVRLVADPATGPVPRITAITCETTAESDRLRPLPDSTPSAAEAAWINSHTITAGSPGLGRIMEEIRRAHKIPSAAATSPIRFEKHKLDGAFRSEGVAVADFNGDGRLDVLIPSGWWEGPADTGQSPWPFHEAGLYGGAQLCVSDFDGDGNSDVLGSSAHGYGISWCEQTPDGWQIHEIDKSVSQTHALRLADLNGDGLMDFVTGKRFSAHTGRDPGPYEPALLCWFEQKRTDGHPEWVRHLINVDSGVGLQFEIVDVNGDRLLDVVTANKKGVYYFQQVRP